MNRFWKRLLSLLLCVALTAGLLPGTALATATDVIAVAAVENLRAMDAGSYILSNDIDLPDDWEPIANFSGTLDGNGHTINLKGAPLFESIAESGRVINLLLVGEVTAKDNEDTGALAKTCAGTVANSYTAVTITNKCFVATKGVGGFIGRLTGTGSVSNCLSVGTTPSEGRPYFGGIVGIGDKTATVSYSYWLKRPDYAGWFTTVEHCEGYETTDSLKTLGPKLNEQKGEYLTWGANTDGYPVPGGTGDMTNEVDKEGLNALILKAEAIEGRYTEESWLNFQSVLTEAKRVSTSASAIQSDVARATEDLSDAIKELVIDDTENTNRTALIEAIEDAIGIVRNEMHTYGSWNAFEGARTTAQEVNVNPSSTQEEINSATQALTTAQAGLTRWTADVVQEPEHVVSVQSVDDLKNMGATNAYYRLDADLTVTRPLAELKGTFDGNGHVITLSGGALFESIAETATIQNLGLKGSVGSTGGSGEGAGFVAGDCKGRILNSYSKANVAGRHVAAGLVGRLNGGFISNVFFSGTLSIGPAEQNVERIVAGLVSRYHAGAIRNSYWLSAQANFAVGDNAYFHPSMVSKDRSDLADDAFLENLNHVSAGGRIWHCDSDGLPYLGDEDLDYVPPLGTGVFNDCAVSFLPYVGGGTDLGEGRTLDSHGLTLTLGDLNAEKDAGLLRLEMDSGEKVRWKSSNSKIGIYFLGGDLNARECVLYATGTGSAIIEIYEESENPNAPRRVFAQFPVEVIKGQITEVKYYIDDRPVSAGQEVEIAGYQWSTVKVTVRHPGSETEQEVSAQQTIVSAVGSKIVSTSGRSFVFHKPGDANITVSALGENITFKVKSIYVPITGIKPGPNQTRPEPNSPEARYKDAQGNYILHERNPNSASLTDFNKLQDTPNVIVEPANASYGQHWTLESSDPSVAQFVDSLVVRVVPYKAGTVIFTATSKDEGPSAQVSGKSTASFVYLNPVQSVTAQSSHITVMENKAQALPLVFTGPKSAEGYHVSEAGMDWTFTSTDGGAVEIYRGAESISVRSDKEYYVANDQYQIRGITKGTVTAVGTPVDQTRGAAPITLTITVIRGEAEVPADISAQVSLGMSSGISYLKHTQGARPFAYNSEWEIFALLRSGVSLDAAALEPYFASIANTFANPKGDLLKPTTLARVALALTAAGQDASDFRGINFFALLGENTLMTTGSNEPMWTLIALDSKGYDSMGSWSREALVAELLRYQNPQTGGFGLTDNRTTGVDITAMALQALAKYKDRDEVSAAIDKALAHLREAQKRDGGFDNNCEASVQVLVALCMLGLDPLDEANGFVKGVNRNLIMSIMSYRVETEPYGFIHIADTLPQPMTTDQAVYGLSAYARFLDGRPGIYDMSDLTAAGVLESQLSRVNTLREEDYTPESWAVLSGAKAAAEAALAKGTATDEELTAAGVALSAAVNALVKKPAQPDTPGQPGEPEKPEEKPLNVSIRVVGDVLHEEEAHGKYQTWISTEEYTMPKGSTVYDLLELALMSNGMGFEESQYSYIGSIQAPDVLGGYWLSEFDNGPGSGWKYLVNGTYPGVGLRSKPLKDGDAVVWRYVDDYTNEFDNTDKWQEAPDVAPVAPPAEAEKPDGENIEQLKPEITVDRTGEAKVELSAKDVEHATEDIVLTPVIQGDARKVSVTLPKETLSAIASELGITLKTEIADLKLSANALGELGRSAGESLSISAENMKDENGRPDGRVRLELQVDGQAVGRISGGLLATLPVTAATPGTVLLEVTEEGARVIKKSAVEDARLTARLEGSATVMVKENTKPFADVSERHWGASAVAFATAHELFTGTATDTFGPEGEASRAMLFTVLARLEGQNTSGATWYDASLRWAVENGLTDGSSPESAITREQLATLLYRYAGTPGGHSVAAAQEFPDGAQVSSWAEEAVSWAVGEGLLTGKEHGALDPAGTASRVEVAALFQRLMPILLQS